MSKRFILRLCVVSTLLFFLIGGVGLRSQASQQTNTMNQEASINMVTPIDPRISKYAVGDVDFDFKDEVVVDFGTAGIWLYNQGSWTQLAPENPESLFGFRRSYDFNAVLADLGPLGLWRWDHPGTWSQLSTADVESMANGHEMIGGGSDGRYVLFADFGGLGTWLLWFGSIIYDPWLNWIQLSSANAEYIMTGNRPLGAWSNIFGDFGSLGLWECLPLLGSSSWNQLSSANADYITRGRSWLAADFGSLGLWTYNLDSSTWAHLTGANADLVIAADINADNLDEIVGDFGNQGLWLWDTQWTQLTDANAEYMISADVTGDGTDEIAVDLGSAGLWVWNNGPWSQISTMNPEYLVSADTNGDGAKEILADFGASGLWLWNGAWTQISEDNPD